MKRLIAMIVCVAAACLMCGCEGDSSGSGNPPVLKPEATGITPALGRYAMSVDGQVPSNGYWYQTTFIVTATDMISYTSDTFSYYAIPIHNGGVSYSNGSYYWPLNGKEVMMEDGNGGCPTDGFAMYAKWTSPTHCEGTVWFGSSSGMSFTADL